jgi:hypothetical protein
MRVARDTTQGTPLPECFVVLVRSGRIETRMLGFVAPSGAALSVVYRNRGPTQGPD